MEQQTHSISPRQAAIYAVLVVFILASCATQLKHWFPHSTTKTLYQEINSEAGKSWDVWILAGQSNMWGANDDLLPNPPEAEPWPGRVLMWSFRDKQWQNATHNVHGNSHGVYFEARSVGVDIGFARELISGLGVAQVVGLVPAAELGTNLYRQWHAPDSFLFQRMVGNTVEAMEAARAQGLEPRLRGMVWIQGEGDAQPSDTDDEGRPWAESYGAQLRHFVDTTRAALQAYHDSLPVVVVLMGVQGREGLLPLIRRVRQEQEQVEMPGLIKADMEGLPYTPRDTPHKLHLTKEGSVALAQRCARAYVQWLKTTPAGG